MEKSPKIAKKFYCCDCDYKCYKQCDYDKHILTSKHQFRTNLNDLSPKNSEKIYLCNSCNKTYKARNSLWYHQKKCLSDFEKVEEQKIQLENEFHYTLKDLQNTNRNLNLDKWIKLDY